MKFLCGLLGAIVGAVSGVIVVVSVILASAYSWLYQPEPFKIFFLSSSLWLLVVSGVSAWGAMLLRQYMVTIKAESRARTWLIVRVMTSLLIFDASALYIGIHFNDPPSDRVLMTEFSRRDMTGKDGECYWLLNNSKQNVEEKGYIYCETPPSPLLPGLDGHTFYHRPNGGIQCVYRHITGNWYLYLLYYDD